MFEKMMNNPLEAASSTSSYVTICILYFVHGIHHTMYIWINKFQDNLIICRWHNVTSKSVTSTVDCIISMLSWFCTETLTVLIRKLFKFCSAKKKNKFTRLNQICLPNWKQLRWKFILNGSHWLTIVVQNK